MKCPKCAAAMTEVEFEGVAVDRCSGCSGIWFDLNEEQKLAAMKGSAEALDTGLSSVDGAKSAELNAQRKIKCPKCENPMIPMVSLNGKVHYESCKTCFGAFFDAGELTEFKKKNSFMDWFK